MVVFQTRGAVRTNAASAFAAAVSGAFPPAALASQSTSSFVRMKTALRIPSPKRQARAIIARSGSWSRVIAYSVTARTMAVKHVKSVSRTATCMSVACSAIRASFAAVPSAPAARPKRLRTKKRNRAGIGIVECSLAGWRARPMPLEPEGRSR